MVVPSKRTTQSISRRSDISIWLFWQLVFMAIAFFFGWLSLRPRFLWSDWPSIGMLVSYIISMPFMGLVFSGNK